MMKTRKLKVIISNMGKRSRVVDAETGEEIANVVEHDVSIAGSSSYIPVVHLTLLGVELELDRSPKQSSE